MKGDERLAEAEAALAELHGKIRADEPLHAISQAQLIAVRVFRDAVQQIKAIVDGHDATRAMTPAAEAEVVQGLIDRTTVPMRRLAERMARESLGRIVALGLGIAAVLMAATGAASLWIGYRQGVAFASLDAGMATCRHGTVQTDTKTSRRVCVYVFYLDPTATPGER